MDCGELPLRSQPERRWPMKSTGEPRSHFTVESERSKADQGQARRQRLLSNTQETAAPTAGTAGAAL
jgi:hypothetical protein